MMLGWEFLIGAFLINLLKTDALPVIVDNFQDDWEYQIKPHSMPLLNITSRNHILPPEPKTLYKEMAITKRKTTRIAKIPGNAVHSMVSCASCKLGTGLLLREIKKGTPFADIKEQFVSLCAVLKLQTATVCAGIFETFGPQVVPALNISNLEPMDICKLALGEGCDKEEKPEYQWSVDLPDIPKPVYKKQPLPKEGSPTLKVLHLSDTHWDPEYQEGTPANCEEPLCCRGYSTLKKDEEAIPAGRWGAYQKCDSPKILIENMLRNIAEEHPDIDYIIWTGDIPAHDIWNQTKKGNSEVIQEMVQLTFEIFRDKAIFPAIGNHESIPAGTFAPPWVTDNEYGISWLYRQVADHWRRWLPASVGNTVLHGAFYSVLLRPGFRLISLNTNYCHSLNWWLLVNNTDPAKELQWLTYELQQAENKGEKVHLIGHIPPGSSDCMKMWSSNFNAIVNRYESTIMGQFYGHSHADEYEVFYETAEPSKPFKGRKKPRWWRRFDKKDTQFAGRATNVAYLGPSVTTYENYNPAYRIYYIDGDHNDTTREVIDHETWTMDLEEANKEKNDPKWYKLYSVKEEYGLESLRPEVWSNLIDNLSNDPELFDRFYKNYYRDSPTRPQCEDSKCKLQILCDLRSAKSNDRHNLCSDLELQFGL